ncbi:tripartite tricarboxylate transporter substrate binding protein [Nitratireductor sp. XY-223]|uniref:tripartite tricarboxylate transporter substrate binding protein n=1 Tax=Nitratireductor sp. XY-223 TaxID=2561926 RepID=UPI0010AA3B1B|nr:tripartite tricarboxylate transporter substrate binding protein [Nitratireductor sp. XY-223]
MIRRHILKFALAAAMLGGLAAPAVAEYPEKPVTLVIPLGAGGSHDLNARVISSIIPAYLNQAMIVRLTPGAGGQKGTQEAATAPADGYTLLFSHNYIDMLQQHVENLPYDPNKDFVPVARVNYAPIGIVVRGDSPFKTFEDVVRHAEENPGALKMAHSGNWGALFVPAAQIMKARGITFNMIPYKGGGPAMQALLKGEADITMGFPATLSSLLDSGEVRLLATAGNETMVEGVPTFPEIGVDGDVGFMHRVVLAPADTPPEVLETLRTAFKALQEDKTYTRLMGRLGENRDFLDGPDYQKMREAQALEYKALVDQITSN